MSKDVQEAIIEYNCLEQVAFQKVNWINHNYQCQNLQGKPRCMYWKF